MPHVRVTVVKPKAGRTSDALAALEELDNMFAVHPGLVMSLVFSPSRATNGTMGRIAVWETEDAANQLALSERGLALRSRIHEYAAEDIVETLAEVTNAHYLAGVVR